MGKVKSVDILLLIALTLATVGYRLYFHSLDARLSVILIGVILGYYAISKRQRLGHLPSMSDDEFARGTGVFSPAEREKIISARRSIARILGVPRRKLCPGYTLSEIGDRLEFFGSFSVAVSDLEDELVGLLGPDKHQVASLLELSIGRIAMALAERRNSQ